MADNKSSEGIRPIKHATHGIKSGPASPRPPKPPAIKGVDSSTGEDFTVNAFFDINRTIKGLKAIQREAKKATAALKELEEQKKNNMLLPSNLILINKEQHEKLKNQSIEGLKPHTVVFDEMHSMCPRCGKANFEVTTMREVEHGKIRLFRKTCLDCGWKS
jgi:ribosomal protein S27AE